MRSYQDIDDAASTDPVACGVRSPVWLVYDILEKRDLVTLQAGAVGISKKACLSVRGLSSHMLF